jgi:hypothetical protein
MRMMSSKVSFLSNKRCKWLNPLTAPGIWAVFRREYILYYPKLKPYGVRAFDREEELIGVLAKHFING